MDKRKTLVFKQRDGTTISAKEVLHTVKGKTRSQYKAKERLHIGTKTSESKLKSENREYKKKTSDNEESAWNVFNNKINRIYGPIVLLAKVEEINKLDDSNDSDDSDDSDEERIEEKNSSFIKWISPNITPIRLSLMHINGNEYMNKSATEFFNIYQPIDICQVLVVNPIPGNLKYVSLKASHGKYLRCDSDTSNIISCSSNVVSDREYWEPIYIPENNSESSYPVLVAFKSKFGSYLSFDIKNNWLTCTYIEEDISSHNRNFSLISVFYAMMQKIFINTILNEKSEEPISEIVKRINKSNLE